MKELLYRWFVLAIAVWVAAEFVPGIGYDDGFSLFSAALVLGILNVFVKPALRFFSLPIIFLSLGLFLLVINAIVLGLTAWMVPGFHVYGFWSAIGGSIIISIVSSFLGVSGRTERIVVEHDPTVYREPRNPPPGKGPIIDV